MTAEGSEVKQPFPPPGYQLADPGKGECKKQHENILGFNPDPVKYHHGYHCTDCQASWGFPRPKVILESGGQIARRQTVTRRQQFAKRLASPT